MSIPAPDEISMEDPLCDSSLGSMVTLDYVTPLTDKLSQQNRVIKFCIDAGFLITVDVGQYFMAKDTEEFSQSAESVACREYTLPRDENSSEPKGGIRGNTKIEPVLEVTTSYLQGKYGVEIRIKSMNKDNSHSWVRISHCLNELVTELSDNKENDNNEQETSEMQFDNFVLKSNARVFASRSKAKAKPPTHKNFTHRGKKFDYPVSKRLPTLLRHGQLPREEYGAIDSWRLKENLRNDFENSQH